MLTNKLPNGICLFNDRKDHPHRLTCSYEFFWISARPFTSCMCPYPEGLLHLVQPALGLGPRPFLEKHHRCVGGHKDLHYSHMGTSS